MSDKTAHEFFDEAYTNFFKSVYLCAYAILLNTEEAKDITQEVFEKFYKRNQKFHSLQDVKFHLLRNCKNHSFNLLKHKKIENKKKPLLVNDYLITSVDNMFEFENLSRLIDEALLNKKDLKEIFLMRVIMELSYQDIAVLLGLPLNNVKSKLYRARILIREKVEELNKKL